MKYLVTSSLNIDNILSSESISPYSFYEKRDFGYRTFFQIPQLAFDNVLVLFSEIPDFKIEDLERENHPLVVQIDDEEQLRNVKGVATMGNCKVFTFCNTIRLTPFNCRLLFFTDKARILSRQNCMDSKLNKLINYYKFETIKPSTLQLEALVSLIDKEVIDKSTVCYYDNDFDRAKGFVYGYYIGCRMGLSPKIAGVLSKQKRIYDIISAKLNNIGTTTGLLDSELKDLDMNLMNNDPAKEKASCLWESIALKHNLSLDNLSAFLNEIGMEYDVKVKFAKNNGITFYTEMNRCYGLENYRATLNGYVGSLIYSERKGCINIVDDIKITEDYNFHLTCTDDEKTRLFNCLIGKVVDMNIDELRFSRFEKVNFFGKLIREFFVQNGRNFDESSERAYWASLAMNVKKSEPFKLRDCNNIVLQSLAAFILKGEDFDSLVDYLAVNAIPTYKYALAFWGATLGYVGMSRSLLEREIKRTEFEGNFYPQVYKLMIGRDMNERIQVYQPVTSFDEDDMPKGPVSKETFRRKVFETFSVIKKGLKNQDKLHDGLCKALDKIGDNVDYFNFIAVLNDFVDYGWAQKKQPWIRMQDKLCSDYKSIVNHKKSVPLDGNVNKDLFQNIGTKVSPSKGRKDVRFILKYDNSEDIAKSIQRKFKLDDKVTKLIKDDLIWVLEPKYAKEKRYEQLIDDIRLQLVGGAELPVTKNGKSLEWKNEEYSKLDIDAIMEFLKHICNG